MGLKDSMGDMADKAKDALKGHGDQAEKGVDKAGDMVDKKTGNKYQDKVDKAQDAAKDGINKLNK
jgi:MT0933-like antitoxin protein